MRPISHGSTGICGSRHWAHGKNIPSCPERKCVYFPTIATYSVFLSKIRSRRSRHARCALCFGNIGLHPWLRNAHKACGGGGNSWDFMHRRSNATPLAISARSKCLTSNRVGDSSEAFTGTLICVQIRANCASTWLTPSSQHDNRTCHALLHLAEWMRNRYKCPAPRWHSDGAQAGKGNFE